MQIPYLIIAFLIGTFMGSFYTVVGSRLPKNEDFIKTRSHCDHCNHTLSFLDMIPILSYILLRGRCRYCHKRINNISTYMELFSGILYALALYVFGLSYELFISIGIISLLIIVSVSDIRYLIIPDEVLVFFACYFIILITIHSGVKTSLLAIASGLIMFAFMYLVMLVGNFIFKKESLGGGDIKLMFVIGLILNPLLGVFSIFLASLLALPVSILILLRRRNNLVPFGPFLITSLMFIYFTKLDLKLIIDYLLNF